MKIEKCKKCSSYPSFIVYGDGSYSHSCSCGVVHMCSLESAINDWNDDNKIEELLINEECLFQLNCPSCGELPKVVVHKSADLATFGCDDCGLHSSTFMFSDLHRLIDEWNEYIIYKLKESELVECLF